MVKLAVDSEKCVKCGTCSDICVAGIIEPGDVPHVSKENALVCMICGQCEAVCPQGAMELVDPSLEGTMDNKIGDIGSSKQIGNYLRGRRSVRHYKNETVDRKVLEEVMDIVRYAPSAGNGQPVKWMIVHDPVKVKKVAGLTIDWIKNVISEAPPDQDFTGFNLLVEAWENGTDLVLRGAPHVVIAYAEQDENNPMSQFVSVDGVIALTHLDLALPSFGLGSCWAGGLFMALNQWPPLAEELELPEGHTFIGAMMVGYPQYQYHNIPKRNKAVVDWK